MTCTLPIAENIIAKMGGPVMVGRIVGLSHSAVCKWKKPPNCGGTGGLVPSRHQNKLLAHARAHGIDLTPADFFPPSGQEGRAA